MIFGLSSAFCCSILAYIVAVNLAKWVLILVGGISRFHAHMSIKCIWMLSMVLWGSLYSYRIIEAWKLPILKRITILDPEAVFLAGHTIAFDIDSFFWNPITIDLILHHIAAIFCSIVAVVNPWNQIYIHYSCGFATITNIFMTVRKLENLDLKTRKLIDKAFYISFVLIRGVVWPFLAATMVFDQAYLLYISHPFMTLPRKLFVIPSVFLCIFQFHFAFKIAQKLLGCRSKHIKDQYSQDLSPVKGR